MVKALPVPRFRPLPLLQGVRVASFFLSAS